MCVCVRAHVCSREEQGRPRARQTDRLGKYIFTLTEGSGSEGLVTTTGWLHSEMHCRRKGDIRDSGQG